MRAMGSSAAVRDAEVPVADAAAEAVARVPVSTRTGVNT
jgi:hypothetical protein